ncbi:HIT family protein [Streptosporangium sandarakinum]|uniref:Histidine triad (HIT) family protein/ATP adenylyltransferase n=1 Tax=Streptosporangium sandarakinum TaxID=1260955 RepID=A0A852URQ9_9ACTN|nr:HIT family protein [Streptosporangium sandarakinum]NYF38288.1 histidine triad (HIT) family protein/ATP adenylyltransferase [Streptosporangium sandarakinum]
MTSTPAERPHSQEAIVTDPVRRVPFDVEGYSRRSRTGPCFICAIVSGDPGQPEEIVYDDGTHIGFLARFAALPGYVLVAPMAHVEHVVRDLDEEGFTAMMRVVRRVARALEASVPCERTYLLSLGSQEGNSHLHWHIAALPPGVPYERQQYHALMSENGVVEHTPQEAAALAAKIRRALGTCTQDGLQGGT